MAEDATTVDEGPPLAVEAPPAPAPTPRHADPIQVARFPVRRRLGAGAMGVVLVARDETLDREIAIKLVRPGKRGSSSAKQRLLREAQAMARVAHPNVVAIYEAGLHDDGVYIAMELVHGRPLDEWLRLAPRSVTDIVAQFIQAGRGLGAAHARGIIHRDFKPANVLVGDDGRTRVVDFGLARGTAVIPGRDDDHHALDVARPDAPGGPPPESGGAGAGAGSGGTPAGSSSGTGSSGSSSSGNILAAELTGHGAMLGTPAFMSLEHFRGKTVAASDQYSFGVSLFRALYGKAPYEGDGILGLYEAILHDPAPTPPPRPDVPSRLVAAVLRAMAKDADARWPSMEALVAELEAIVGVDPEHDPARSRNQRRKIAMMITGFAAVSGIVAGLRSGWGKVFTLRYLFTQSLLGGLAFAILLFVFRRSVLRDTYGRRLVSLFAVLMLGINVHRATAFFSDTSLLAVLRADAVFVAAIGVFASLVLERWIVYSAVLMGVFLVTSFVVPQLAVPVFGTCLISTLALAAWAWREPDER